MKRAISYLLMLLIVSGLLAACSALLYLATPPTSEKRIKIISVLPGVPFNQVAIMLKKEGIVNDVRKFSLLVRCFRGTRRIKAGTYHMDTSMLPLEVFHTLVKGKALERSITIPEGYNLYQVADLFDRAGLVNRERFLQMCFAPLFISSFGVEGISLEGYLFPDTYRIPSDFGERSTLALMVARFKEVYARDYAEKAEKSGFTMKQVVTLASIIEKETGESTERPLISAVFQNRLKKGMRLQSDPTAVYGIENFDGKVRKKHLNRQSPYNTYRRQGLPPGPIANPGAESIRAVLYPAEVNYLYFVSKNDGTHYFSSNLREHNLAVGKYQRKKR